MYKKLPIRSFTILSLFLFIFSCEKQNVEPANEVFQLQAYQFQIAEIHSAPNAFSGTTYIGNIGDLEIEFSAINDSVLVFYIGNIEPGKYTLKIPALGDGFSGELTVLEMKLNAEPGVIVNGFTKELQIAADNIFAEFEDDRAQLAISNLTDVFNNASDEDKYIMAATYEANKEIFSKLIVPFDEDSGGRNSEICYTNLCKFKVTVAAIAVGGFLLSTRNNYAMVASIPFFIVGLFNTIKYHEAFTKEVIKLLEIIINKIVETDRANSEITLIVDQPYSISLSSVKRTVNETDENGNNELLSQFFDYRDLLQKNINELNSTIEFLNNNVPFFDEDRVDNLAPITEGSHKEDNINEHDFNNYSFNIIHSGIDLEVSFLEKGKVKLLLNAEESVDFSSPIDTKLQIEYVDDYNKEIKTFDINVIQDTIPHFTIISEIPDSAYVNSTIDSIAVKVVNQFNNPIKNMLISWDILEGGGQLISKDIVTNASGYAYASWEIGSTPGNNQLVVKGFDNGEEIDNSPIVVNITGVFDLKDYLVTKSPWEWNNYGEHAFYEFLEGGSVKILWEKQKNNEFTGEYSTHYETWEIIHDNIFRTVSNPDEDDDIFQYTLTSIEENSFTANVCSDPDFTDCGVEIFVSTK